MKLRKLSVQNFRALKNLELSELADGVVLAGPNGCGKSCVLDAIRLLKSAYGGYQQNEWNTWFGEFHIDLSQQSRDLQTLFRDGKQPLAIAGEFHLSEEELQFLQANATELLEEKAWRDTVGPDGDPRRLRALASEQRGRMADVRSRAQRMMRSFRHGLQQPVQLAELRIDSEKGSEATPNLLLEVLFSTYRPQDLGIIDYHGPNRTYNRERLGNISLTIQSTEERQRNHALYNYSSKYANLKTEMASAYVRHLIALRANPSAASDDSLTSTLKELFATFFPGKQFLGPRPTSDGRLLFPVLVGGDIEHDIDDLSSGEKEVLYGYLRLQNSAPRRSIILIDEPELHLNPRLIGGLAAFYYRHLGQSLENQLWLVTHSDTLIREAVEQSHYSVFHVHPSSSDASSQASEVKAQAQLDRVVMDLVGDLAAYRPGAKIVVFESTDDAAFDMRMTCSLFPEFAQRTNQIAAGSRGRVAELHELLEKARISGHLPGRFFAITDADTEPQPSVDGRYAWDVYHIENYLLEPTIILDAVRSVGVSASVLRDADEVEAALLACAKESMQSLVAHHITKYANAHLVGAINLRFDAKAANPPQALTEAIRRSRDRIDLAIGDTLDAKRLEAVAHEYSAQLTTALEDRTWLSKFRGRDVLRRFVGAKVGGMTYERLRDLVISKMAERRYRPLGMEKVVNLILDS